MTEKNLIIVASGNSELGHSVVQNLLNEDNFEIAASKSLQLVSVKI